MNIPYCLTVLLYFSSKFTAPFTENLISDFLFPQTSHIPFLLSPANFQLMASPLISLKQLKYYQKELTHLSTVKSESACNDFSSYLLIILTLSVAIYCSGGFGVKPSPYSLHYQLIQHQTFTRAVCIHHISFLILSFTFPHLLLVEP